MNCCGEAMEVIDRDKECGATFLTYRCRVCSNEEVGRDPQELTESLYEGIDWYGIYGLPCAPGSPLE